MKLFTNFLHIYRYMKKTFILSLLAISLFIFPLTVSARGNQNDDHEQRGIIKKMQEMMNKDDKQASREQKKQELANTKKGKMVHIIDGIVTAVSDGTITVEKDSTTYTVLTDSNTKCRRHFWGKCSIDEVVVNDHVNVWGRVSQDSNTTIQAMMIRNLSVMKRYGVFIGEITAKGANSFTLKTVSRGSQEVTFNSSTKWVNRKQQTITYTDVQVGHRVRVRGVWDKSNNTISEVKEVKDFSLPALISGTPAPTTSTTPTPTTSITPTLTSTPTPTNTPTPTP